MHFKEYGIIEDEDGAPVLMSDGCNEIRSRPGINKCKRKLAAFILQGQEACFIHHLTVLCSKKEIPVYKNEHDGIINGKEIPKKLIKKAAKLSGINNPILDKKPLCSREIRNEMKEYVKS